MVKADLVKKLREKTGVGMMMCKEALREAEGDMTKAMAIRPVMDILADEYDFDLGLMG